VVNVGDNAEVADIFHILYLMAGFVKSFSGKAHQAGGMGRT